MAALNELINQVKDPDLRRRLQEEADKLDKHKKFGLIFENHLPEWSILNDTPIKNGSTVVLKDVNINKTYLVQKVDGLSVTCLDQQTGSVNTFNLNELVAVAEFGKPIYPYLKQLDSVCNAPDNKLWHILIEAENYHALQLLEYLYTNKVDCIYIDPPYNSGARDWKYNNNYVDSSDDYRHSKWLSMMEKRLRLAKKLLNPQDSVLICTIDEKEYLHLGCLLEELFPNARIQMVTSVTNPGGVSRQNEFGRVDEYLFFVFVGKSVPQLVDLDDDWTSSLGGGGKIYSWTNELGFTVSKWSGQPSCTQSRLFLSHLC